MPFLAGPIVLFPTSFVPNSMFYSGSMKCSPARRRPGRSPNIFSNFVHFWTPAAPPNERLLPQRGASDSLLRRPLVWTTDKYRPVFEKGPIQHLNTAILPTRCLVVVAHAAAHTL